MLGRAALVALACSVFAGCLVPTTPNPTPSSHAGTPAATDADMQKFDAITKQLEEHRTKALDDSAMELEAHGNVLYWKTYPGMAPVLHSHDADHDTTVDYEFGIGAGDDNNFRASSGVVATAALRGDKVRYELFDARAANAPEGAVEFDAPTDEQKYWAYAVSGAALYVVTTGAAHTIWKVGAGEQKATKLFTLEEAGIKVGIFMDFAVDNTTLMLVESGRLWRVDLQTREATPMRNETEISGAVSFDVDGVVWEEATALKFFDYQENVVRDLSAELRGLSYRLTDSHGSAHYFSSRTSGPGHCRYGDWLVYTGGAGIFAYNLRSRAVQPILLDTQNETDGRITYVDPVALHKGTLFVTGLTSPSGSVGAEGPVYQVDLNDVLK
ncbi:hypothetical protein AKJ09_11340 [Labilithrix luteola]|uniref:Lipoprotein n=1 Tax=Labilithrix luteola TaxID=1391654 RepID=A0A0K1QG83_9BACT|nr:hypothetical protein [Labilithrix luteola]AKV04677.1 hypothetical protein AKJ09_11340 [Labilithrix luteola]